MTTPTYTTADLESAPALVSGTNESKVTSTANTQTNQARVDGTNQTRIYAPVNMTFVTRDRDVTVTLGTKSIAGRVYSISGSTAPAGTIVKLFRQSDDLVVQQTTTDSNGFYVFPRDAADTNAYYVIAYTTSNTPQIHGVSDRGGVPV